MTEVQAIRYSDIGELRKDRRAGSFEMSCFGEPATIADVKGIRFICPCGCGNESWLPAIRGHVLASGEVGEVPGPHWELSGTLEAPTTRPSVLQSGLPCKWHGYLTDGVWRPC